MMERLPSTTACRRLMWRQQSSGSTRRRAARAYIPEASAPVLHIQLGYLWAPSETYNYHT